MLNPQDIPKRSLIVIEKTAQQLRVSRQSVIELVLREALIKYQETNKIKNSKSTNSVRNQRKNSQSL